MNPKTLRAHETEPEPVKGSPFGCVLLVWRREP
jgi:hypothetical protein